MSQYKEQYREKSESDILEQLSGSEDFELVLYNDDVNTFDHVIQCLVKYCSHHIYQAEQCAHIVHFKGKCVVKSGSFTLLEPMCTALCDQGLSAAVEIV